MSLPKEIQEIVDVCETKHVSNVIVALFEDYVDDYLEVKDDAGYSFFKKLEEENDYERMEYKGGGEGEGEYCYSVIRLGDKFFKAEWSYYSFNGCDYDYIENTVKEVFPKQKTVTIYE